MSTATAPRILAHLEAVSEERRQRDALPMLGQKVQALKAYQQRRFSHTYADLLASPRYGAASRFFLEELYGPSDFSQRDAQFARVVPALVRLFPSEVVETVATLAELHALSEGLDTRMAEALAQPTVDALGYIAAWQTVGHAKARVAQVDLTIAVAARLDNFTRRALMRNSLRLMRTPARAAGLSELQRFLEAGFDTFREMRGASEFMATVRHREQALAEALFAARPTAPADEATRAALAVLP